MTCLNIFLCIIPCTTCVGHEDCHQYTCYKSTGKKSAKSLNAKNNTYDNRNNDRHDSRKHHLVKSCCCGDRNAWFVIRFLSTLHDTRFLTELASYFLDHLISSLGNGFHCECWEEECKHTTDKDTDRNTRSKDIDRIQIYCIRIRYKQCKCCKGCGTDRETFTHSCCCVTYRVKLICDLTNWLIQTWHLCNTTGIVSDRSICVNGNCDSCCGKHTNRCKSDSV